MVNESARDIATPPGQGGLAARIGSGRAFPDLAARIGARLARFTGRPFRFGATVIAARYADVAAVLARDLDFLVAPVNAARIEAVNGPFVLGMDRGPVLERSRRALYSALAAVDQAALAAAAAADVDAILNTGTHHDAVGGYARIVAGNTAQRLFGIGGADQPLFRDAVRAIFAHIFLNIGGDTVVAARALAASTLMRGWFDTEIARRRATASLGDDMMGQLLRQQIVDDAGVRQTLGGMLVGSIDTTAGCAARVLMVMAQDADLRRRAALAASDPALLHAYCQEALRLWPHNPFLLRQAAHATTLAGVRIDAGDRVIVWTQAAMQDRAVFPEPRRMLPDRDPHAYLHLGGGLHRCAGRAIDAWQLPLLVGGLLARDYAIDGAPAWAGPFPDHLPIRLKGAGS